MDRNEMYNELMKEIDDVLDSITQEEWLEMIEEIKTTDYRSMLQYK